MAGNILVTNISYIWGSHQDRKTPLSGNELHDLPHITDGYICVENGFITRLGPMNEVPESGGFHVIDAKGGHVLPSWCDSHTHLVHAASREQEFEMRLHGKTYEEIAEAGGGILNSAAKLRAMSASELYDVSYERWKAVQKMGTGAIEIKSGYGLDFDSEVKMLRVIRSLKETNEIPVKATFLGAHAIPTAYKGNPDAYIDEVVDKMLPYIAGEGLADYIDAFCDTGFITTDQTSRILEAGEKYGLKGKIHANELAVSGGVQVGVKHGALSVDHLESMDDASIQSLASSNTIGTMLPGCAFFLGIPFPEARKMIQANAHLALASDYNPGTAPSGNMNMVVSLACIRMKMTPQEAINAATLNGAVAMDLVDEVGSITIGKWGSFIITEPMSSLAFFPYSFGNHPIKCVVRKGEVL